MFGNGIGTNGAYGAFADAYTHCPPYGGVTRAEPQVPAPHRAQGSATSTQNTYLDSWCLQEMDKAGIAIEHALYCSRAAPTATLASAAAAVTPGAAGWGSCAIPARSAPIAQPAASTESVYSSGMPTAGRGGDPAAAAPPAAHAGGCACPCPGCQQWLVEPESLRSVLVCALGARHPGGGGSGYLAGFRDCWAAGDDQQLYGASCDDDDEDGEECTSASVTESLARTLRQRPELLHLLLSCEKQLSASALAARRARAVGGAGGAPAPPAAGEWRLR